MAGKISLALNLILIAAVIYLFTQIGGKKESVIQETNHSLSDTTSMDRPLRIAFVNIDSLLLKYEYAQQLNDEMIMEESFVQGKIRNKMDKLQKEAETFQQNVMQGIDKSITSEEQFQNKMLQYQYQAEDYQQAQMRKLEEKTMAMNDTLLSIFDDYIEQLVTETPYDFILKDGLGGSLMHKNKAFDITEKMIADLNATYEATAKEEE